MKNPTSSSVLRKRTSYDQILLCHISQSLTEPAITTQHDAARAKRDKFWCSDRSTESTPKKEVNNKEFEKGGEAMTTVIENRCLDTITTDSGNLNLEPTDKEDMQHVAQISNVIGTHVSAPTVVILVPAFCDAEEFPKEKPNYRLSLHHRFAKFSWIQKKSNNLEEPAFRNAMEQGFTVLHGSFHVILHMLMLMY
ncbi:hypothetical protein L1987_53607 [Smallanthus sonchifolius]|uniref:Uncharacterized protein n=1 Tax=Smallanthus sonchifolius TaxID=185202 RepID=A0ACB9EWQ8_9ASTR|nr:hypothetical protein L1987_53607 [Smallanthus sonchifolius]